MILKKIWERYFFWETFKATLFFIITFFSLFAVIDYASHAASYHRNNVSFEWQSVLFFYASEFVSRLDVMLPFSLLVATIKVLCDLNQHNELVALLSSGISLRSLMRPFVLLGLFATGIVYINSQFLQPAALREIEKTESKRSSKKHQQMKKRGVQHLLLKDGTTLIFQQYESDENRFFDSYWVKNADQLYRIKYLYPFEEISRGRFVDHLVRNQQGELTVVNTAVEQRFPELVFNKEALFQTLTPAEELSFSALWKQLPGFYETENEKEAQTLTAFYYKLVMPWLCLFAVIGPAPFCLRFTRNLPLFFIYAMSLFCIVAFDIVMNAAVVLGERQVLAPLLAIGLPFGLIALLLFWNGYRCKILWT